MTDPYGPPTWFEATAAVLFEQTFTDKHLDRALAIALTSPQQPANRPRGTGGKTATVTSKTRSNSEVQALLYWLRDMRWEVQRLGGPLVDERDADPSARDTVRPWTTGGTDVGAVEHVALIRARSALDVLSVYTTLTGYSGDVKYPKPWGLEAADRELRPGPALRFTRAVWSYVVRRRVLSVLAVAPRGLFDDDLVSLTIAAEVASEAATDGDDVALHRAVEELNRVTDLLLSDVIHRLMNDASIAFSLLHFGLLELDPAVGPDMSRLLDVSVRTLRRWRGGAPIGPAKRERVRLVAELVRGLRSSMTVQGIVQWFDRPRTELAGRTPLTVLDDDDLDARELLVPLVRRLRR
jgi:hypothetical protein